MIYNCIKSDIIIYRRIIKYKCALNGRFIVFRDATSAPSRAPQG